MSRLGSALLSATGIFLVVLGLTSLNTAAFHWWLSWGPPSPNPQYHIVLAVAFLILAIGLGWFGVFCSAVGKKKRNAS